MITSTTLIDREHTPASTSTKRHSRTLRSASRSSLTGPKATVGRGSLSSIWATSNRLYNPTKKDLRLILKISS